MSREFVQGYAHPKGAIVEKPGVGILFAAGTTVPTDGTTGFAPGCVFIDENAAQGSQFFINEGSATSCDFNVIALGGLSLATLTATAAELNYLDADLATNTLSRGTGVDTAESYVGSVSRVGGLIHTRIVLDLSTLIGSATDLDIIGESAAANCTWGQITTAKSGTLIGGKVTCLEVPAGGATDIDFYSSNVATGTQDVIVTDAALGTETALVTSGGAWTSGATKGMTGLPTANDYLYVVNGAASGGTFTAGKFLIELFGT
jgi:hypothetical protein